MEAYLKCKFVIVVTGGSDMELALVNHNKSLELYQIRLTVSNFAGEVSTKNQIIQHLEKVLLKRGSSYDMGFTLSLGSSYEHMVTVHVTVPQKSIAIKSLIIYPVKKIMTKTLHPDVRQLMVEIINMKNAK